jgi:hypothetical protein
MKNDEEEDDMFVKRLSFEQKDLNLCRKMFQNYFKRKTV